MWISSLPCSIYNRFVAQLKKTLGRSNDFVFVKTNRPDSFFKGHLCFVTLLKRLSYILGFFEE